MREAGEDWTKIGLLTKERKVWKCKVSERMKHLRDWENSKGHSWSDPPLLRDVEKLDEGLACDVCGKVCKSKAGLTIHRKRMHEVSSQKKNFPCGDCGKIFTQEANLKTHVKVCAGEANKRRCINCGEVVETKGLAAHRRVCAGAPQERPQARVYKGKRKNCPNCGKEMAATNIARHIREACQDGGAHP